MEKLKEISGQRWGVERLCQFLHLHHCSPVCIFLVFVFMSGYVAVGQPAVTLSAIGSYTVPNSSEWSYIADFGTGLDVAVAWRQDWGYGSNCFFPLLRTPYEMGVRGNFTYFPNAIAGQRIGVSGFLQQPLWRFRYRLMFNGDSVPVTVLNPLNLEMDCGLALYTDPYSRIPNPDNVFIGSYLNCMIQIGLSYSHCLRNMGHLLVSGKLVHSSNGYLRKPNKGLNYLQFTLGYTLPAASHSTQIRESRFHTEEKECQLRMPVSHWDKWPMDNPAFRGGELFMTYAPGVVMPRYETSKRYFYAHSASLGWLYRFNPARAAGLNLDLTYNYSHTAIIQHWGGHYHLPFYLGAAAVYEATWHRLTLHTAIAAYLTRDTHATTPLYERVGLYYNFGYHYQRLRPYVGLALKSHMAHIDFIEFHVGLRFRARK